MKIVVLFLVLLFATCSGQKNKAGAESDAVGSAGSILEGDSTENVGGMSSEKAINSDDADSQKRTGETNTRNENGMPYSYDSGLTLIIRDSYSGIETAETRVIKDGKSLKKFYSQINRTRKPGVPVPDIDFSQEMVVVRCSGAVDNGAVPELSVQEENESELLLKIGETDATTTTSAITTPFCVYRMPATGKEIVVLK